MKNRNNSICYFITIIRTSTSNIANEGYATTDKIFNLKHNTVTNATTPTYWFTFKSTSSGASKITDTSYTRIHNGYGPGKLHFRIKDSTMQQLVFSGEVDYKDIKNFVPGDYSSTLNMVFDY